ncbi:MAG: ABC transporter substrate-binding protein, partial [Lacisediminimonas sp.]|nr:ABC transporter substrate-binding protein [Lacisediminimonas sp.]
MQPKTVLLVASRVLRTALLILVLLPLYLIAPAHAGAPAPLSIGQVIDLSGSDGAMGRDYTAGIRTFFDMANKAGGVGGRKVEFIVRDDKGDPTLAAEAAEELIGRENVQFLLGGIGENNTRAIVDSSVFRSSGLTLYAPLAVAASSARVALWRPRYERELTFLLRYFEKTGITSVAVAVQQNRLQRDALKHVQSLLKNSRLQNKGSVTISTEPAELARQARTLSELGPGVVIVLSDAVDAGLFLKAYRARSPSGYVAGTALTNLATLQEIAGQAGL